MVVNLKSRCNFSLVLQKPKPSHPSNSIRFSHVSGMTLKARSHQKAALQKNVFAKYDVLEV